MTEQVERALIRALMAIALCIALLAFVLTPVSRDTNGDPVMPAVAFEQVGLYRLEVAVVAFYGILLLATPAFLGLVRGRLPIEISVRGAKFEEKTDRSDEIAETRIEDLELKNNELAEELAVISTELDRLREGSGDNKCLTIDSTR